MLEEMLGNVQFARRLAESGDRPHCGETVL
jgi:hypothetical protein